MRFFLLRQKSLFLVETTDIPAIPIVPANANTADPEAESATDEPEPAHIAVLPHIEDVTMSSSPCVRRVRLRSKTTMPADSPFNVRPTPVSVEGAQPSEKGDLAWWLDMDEHAKSRWVDSRLKDGGQEEYCTALRANHKRTPPRYYSKCNRHDRRQMALMWISAGSGQQVAAPVRQWITENFNQKSAVDKSSPALVYQGKQFLLTCNGDWGLLQVPDHVSLSPEVEAAVRELKKLEVCEKTWLRVKQEAVRIAVEFSAEDWAVGLEVCPKTYAAGSVRLHAHVALQWTKRQKWTLAASDMVFLDGKYNLQSEDAMARRRKAGWQ